MQYEQQGSLLRVFSATRRIRRRCLVAAGLAHLAATSAERPGSRRRVGAGAEGRVALSPLFGRGIENRLGRKSSVVGSGRRIATNTFHFAEKDRPWWAKNACPSTASQRIQLLEESSLKYFR